MTPEYKNFRTINRTVSRPIRTGPIPGLVDLQALPPYGWCPACGSEIYQKDTPLCTRCRAVPNSITRQSRS